jgi:cytochrome bd ubiquinol oxidase subunit II
MEVHMQPDILLAIVVVGALTFYVLLGGADYGGGIWNLLCSGPRAQKQRDVIAHAITPVWEVNHVWLILIIVLLFSGFPPVFAAVTTALHIPIFAMLLGIICRGVSFTVRTYDTRSLRIQRAWGYVFSISSLITPFLLGVVVGAISHGRVVVVNGVSTHGYLRTWFSPFPMIVGCFAVSLFAYLSAAYLTVEASTDDLREDFRKRALLAACVVAGLALLTFLAAAREATEITSALLHHRWSWLEQSVTAFASVTAFLALWSRKYELARIAVAAQVSFILWGWAIAQYPFMVRPLLTIQNSSAPASVQKSLLLACLAGAVILLPSIRYLFGVFKFAPGGMDEQPLH